MEQSAFQRISGEIRRLLDAGVRSFAIFPYGDLGCLTKRVLNDQYQVFDCILIDNLISRYNKSVIPMKDVSTCKEWSKDTYLLLVSLNHPIHEELLKDAEGVFPHDRIIDVFEKEYSSWNEEKNEWRSPVPPTICGKYSYGPLCKDPYVEKTGAFCSFAEGTCVVPNHALNYITTHPIAAQNTNNWIGFKPWEIDTKPYHMDGIIPKGIAPRKRIIIGNDVWIGRNAIITNYSNIGDGVIIGAGAVVTKDIPDYAVVVGNPARIIRYRFSEEQILSLKKICWWDWEDEKIIKYYDDLLEDVDTFIRKHLSD